MALPKKKAPKRKPSKGQPLPVNPGTMPGAAKRKTSGMAKEVSRIKSVQRKQTKPTPRVKVTPVPMPKTKPKRKTRPMPNALDWQIQRKWT